MTVLDTSAVVDLLLDVGAAPRVSALLRSERVATAPDVLVFETLAVLRRHVLHGAVDGDRAAAALSDLGDVSLAIFPSMPLRTAAWQYRSVLTAADALFLALATALGEPLATKDRGLLDAARARDVAVVDLSAT